MLKKKAIVLSFAAVLAASAAFAAIMSDSISSSQNYDDDVVITATSSDHDSLAGVDFVYGIGNDGENDVSVTVSGEHSLTVNSSSPDGNTNAYAVINQATGTVSFSGVGTFNANSTGGAQARAIRNIAAGEVVLSGDITIQSTADTGRAENIDSWANGKITLNGSTYAEARITNGGRALAVGVDSSTVEFNGSKADINAVAEVGRSGQWTNALVTSNGGKVTFNTSSTSLKATDESGGYTAQVMSINDDNDAVTFNGETTTIAASSDYGANGIGCSGLGSVSFNSGDVEIKAEIPKGTGTTNAIGILGGMITVSENVNNFDIVVSGSGIDNGNTGYSNGTAACYLSLGDSMTINAKSFNISVDGGGTAGSVDEYYSDSYGIRMSAGNFITGENTAVNITVNDNAQAAIGVSASGGSSYVNMPGDVTV